MLENNEVAVKFVSICFSCHRLFSYLLKLVSDEASSDCCQLSVSPSSTATEVIRRLLDAKNVDNEQHLYSLIAVPVIGSEQSKGKH